MIPSMWQNWSHNLGPKWGHETYQTQQLRLNVLNVHSCFSFFILRSCVHTWQNWTHVMRLPDWAEGEGNIDTPPCIHLSFFVYEMCSRGATTHLGWKARGKMLTHVRKTTQLPVCWVLNHLKMCVFVCVKEKVVYYYYLLV